jgi:primase-polymerase (primpol)-like protein
VRSNENQRVSAFIPQEMRERDHWVGWREELRDGKPTKPPINPHTGSYASCSDTTTWGTFAQAEQAKERFGLSGIGFMLTRETGIVGIDLDDCRDSETGALEAFADRIVKDFNTYTEVSPSGCGLRLFTFGTLPQGARRKGTIEMYDSGRYRTVTGTRLESLSKDLESRQDAIGSLHDWISKDADLVEQAKRDDPQFSLLWAGDTIQYNGDESRADLALCNMLAPRCDYDPVRMDRIFRRSGLMRPKWDEKHSAYGRTYGQMTIDKALEDRDSAECNKASATADRTLCVVNGYEIYMKNLPQTKKNLPQTQWYVGNILHEGASLLSGDPKVERASWRSRSPSPWPGPREPCVDRSKSDSMAAFSTSLLTTEVRGAFTSACTNSPTMRKR